MPKVLEKVERRLGEKLLLKGERCVGPKCAGIRRNYPPGAHGKSRTKKRRGSSEYGTILREKQKLRFLYGLDDREVRHYAGKAEARAGIFGSHFLRLLESRLDNAVFRLGFAPSRRQARQMVSHGHITVNGRRVTVPSYVVRKGETIAIKEKALGSPFLADLDLRLKKYEPPKWLHLDKNKKVGTVTGIPEMDECEIIADVAKVKEFYSR